jgi:hypothetical protein
VSKNHHMTGEGSLSEGVRESIRVVKIVRRAAAENEHGRLLLAKTRAYQFLVPGEGSPTNKKEV